MRSEGQRRPREVVTSASIPNIWWILGIALFLRTSFPILGFFYTRDITIFYTPDTASYVGPAMELLAHHRFFNAGAPEIVRTPGYPLLLVAGLRLGRLELVTITLQVLLSCVTVYMVYQAASAPAIMMSKKYSPFSAAQSRPRAKPSITVDPPIPVTGCLNGEAHSTNRIQA
jgi:hypothetical protein